MTLPLKRFKFRPLDKKSNVFIITKNNGRLSCSKRFSTQEILTVPFVEFPRERNTLRNVIVGDVDESIGKEIYNNMNDVDEDVVWESVPLKDVQYLSALMKVPLVIVLNCYCDVETKEVYHDLNYSENCLELPTSFESGSYT
jgi:hypothetical protein